MNLPAHSPLRLDDAIVRVKKASSRLQRIEGAVRKFLEPPQVQGRQIPIVFTQAFVIPFGSLAVAQFPIVNGAEDCYLKEASYTAHCVVNGQPTVELMDFPNVLARATGFITETSFCFDFQWNAQLMSTQATYLSQANNAQYLSRRSLGFADKAVRRQLHGLLPFKAGDALLLSVKPTFWGPASTDPEIPNPDVQLTVSFFGTRGPDMVELPEDAALEP